MAFFTGWLGKIGGADGGATPTTQARPEARLRSLNLEAPASRA